MAPAVIVLCHCGAAKQTVRLCDQTSNAPQEISLCHCSTCRHNTGLLCVSYVDIDPPESVEGLVKYHPTAITDTRFFCATCGCHVFRRLEYSANDDNDTGVSGGALATAEKKQSWAVATGVIVGLQEGTQEVHDTGNEVLMRYTKHINTADTKDGGLSPFIQRVGDSSELECLPHFPHTPTKIKESIQESPPDVEVKTYSGENSKVEGESLNAFCHCGTVQFHITRPNAASTLPRSNVPDLMVPYHTGSPQVKNPDDKKWWLRPALGSNSRAPPQGLSTGKGELTRYMAGTCACVSCRLTSGFEIQTWAFIPRVNIFFHIRDNGTDLPGNDSRAPSESQKIIPLDFSTLPANILTSYESSPGVRREFCSRCGATVFWRDRWRPELMDVSVGLLDADEGARAETWLDWWTGRVSFAEDAEIGRTGEIARSARCLIDGLETGLRILGKQGEEGTNSLTQSPGGAS
ncbi:hypothetical protein F5Y07DRAFT_134393 [Xylaria sp. FL0933]|nr:hypothetical protein F5Y07DRAFT_134393 [Xylaria sp. FL0933]